MTGIAFPTTALRSQISSAIDIVLQIARLEDGKRKLVSVQEVNGMEGDIITMSELFAFQREGMDENNNVIGELRATGIVPAFHKGLASRGIDLPVGIFEPDWTQMGNKYND